MRADEGDDPPAFVALAALLRLPPGMTDRGVDFGVRVMVVCTLAVAGRRFEQGARLIHPAPHRQSEGR
jgi:hypothetical protein